MNPAFRSGLGNCLLQCGQLAIPVTRHILVASVSDQAVAWFELDRKAGRAGHKPAGAAFSPRHQFARSFRCSTSRFGIGQVQGSNRTPLGLHRVAEKIGAGWPAGTVFKSRQIAGFTWNGFPDAKVTTRILWLEGLQPGFNRGGSVDSHSRYIYIHGTGDETLLGRPASCGCIHLAGDDLVPLFDRLPSGSLVWVQA